MDVRIHFMQTDDWVGLYVNEALVYEGHSLEPVRLLDLLGVDYTEEWVEDLEDSGYRCPQVRERQLRLPGME